MKKHIENMLIINIINSFDSDFNHQIKWEFFKYEIRKFTRSFSKNKAKSMREKKLNLEKKLKLLEGKLNCNGVKDEYIQPQNHKMSISNHIFSFYEKIFEERLLNS